MYETCTVHGTSNANRGKSRASPKRQIFEKNTRVPPFREGGAAEAESQSARRKFQFCLSEFRRRTERMIRK